MRTFSVAGTAAVLTVSAYSRESSCLTVFTVSPSPLAKAAAVAAAPCATEAAASATNPVATTASTRILSLSFMLSSTTVLANTDVRQR
jgi:hypothetical protein